MDDVNRESEIIVSEILDLLFGRAAGEDLELNSISTLSFADLATCQSRCVIDISEEDVWCYRPGRGDGADMTRCHTFGSSDDSGITQCSRKWSSILDAKTRYITRWKCAAQSSEDLLNLKPEDMCQNWEDVEDTRRKVYWGNRGLIQERYIKTLFRETDTPDDARPSLARVSSHEMPTRVEPYVHSFVTSRRLSKTDDLPDILNGSPKRVTSTIYRGRIVDRKPFLSVMKNKLKDILRRVQCHKIVRNLVPHM